MPERHPPRKTTSASCGRCSTSLLPGWLGDVKTFNRDYRVPIERQGSDERLQHLNARIKPFLLRLEQVATELPPRTEIIHWVDLNEAQRDVYETMRLAMDKKSATKSPVKVWGAARSSFSKHC